MEDPVEYGCGYKDAKLGEKVEFRANGVWNRGEVTKIHKRDFGLVSYSIIGDDGLEYAMSSEWVKQVPYGVSYVADKPKASLEGQVGGEHYKNLAIQPVEYCYRNNIPAIESSIIRYATRHRDKNKAQDIEKIIHYAKILLQLEYNYTDEQIAEL